MPNPNSCGMVAHRLPNGAHNQSAGNTQKREVEIGDPWIFPREMHPFAIRWNFESSHAGGPPAGRDEAKPLEAAG
ncbi:hypothetical protein N7532_007959 [Penicillium argentinense]|uniref:Uncharacterized protein n=1 Tax=Penicillium argentinense TaxID=1131581 RepID=A0A9W9EWQ7_9EURO|nr:uncharacterized protein N7532_007959 [Penicillium argentinense]KAJ5089275.1 hypothetical protein N7532_007959 [Penicillium argentinense]